MKKVLTLLLFSISFSLFSQSIIVDESYKNDSFRKFKLKLENAVTKKDTSLLKPLFYKRVLISADAYDCSGGCTPDYLIKSYFNDKSSVYWEELDHILKYGFSAKNDNLKYSFISDTRDSILFEAPSYIKFINTNLLDGKIKLAVLAENLNLREQPSKKSKIISQVSYGLYDFEMDKTENAQIYTSSNNFEWIKLKLENGLVGFVAARYTSVSITRNLLVAKINGEWKIVEFYQDPGC